MKRIFLIGIALFLSLSYVAAQNVASERAKVKEQVRVEQAALDSVYFEQAQKAIEARQFVLEADRVMFKYGTTAYVNPNTNFVAMEGDKATVQVAFNIPVGGPNGLGGITLDGNVTNFKQKVGKRGTLYISFHVTGTGISADIDISLPQGSSTAQLSIRPTFNSNELQLSGHVLPLSHSNVFKGSAL